MQLTYKTHSTACTNLQPYLQTHGNTVHCLSVYSFPITWAQGK